VRFSLVSKIAENVVKQTLRIREDDVVHITAAKHMLGLAEELAVECRKAGAETTTMYWSEPLWYWSLENLPVEWLRGASKTDLTLLDVATATITMAGSADPRPMGKISPERWQANAEGADVWYRKAIERKVRNATLGISVVTPQRARAYGFNYSAWKRSTENALKTDYSKIAETGRKLRRLMDGAAHEVQITSKTGTDLRFRLAGRKAWVDDGVLDDEDLASGTFDSTLPAGCINVAPDEDSANGTVTFDLPIPSRGKLIKGLKWAFENGRISNFTAAKNGDMIIPVWEKATGDRSKFGWFGIGFNPGAKTGFLGDNIASGAVTIGVGDNKLFGGKNVSTFGFQGTLKKATVAIDNQTVVADGKIAL
jgi:leucyl aminopeptidase (aminopeptidase T)